jgi:hypothetical protein
MAMATRSEEQGRRNKEDQLELLKEIFRLQNRAAEAEANMLNIVCFFLALIKRGVVSVNYDLLDQFMRKFAEAKSSLAWSIARRNNPGMISEREAREPL